MICTQPGQPLGPEDLTEFITIEQAVFEHFSRPLYDVLALVKQTSKVTSVATRTFAQMAAATLTERAAELPTVELLEGVEPRTVASFLSA